METLLSIDKDMNSESFLDCGSRITKLEMYGNDIMNKIASAGFEEWREKWGTEFHVE